MPLLAAQAAFLEIAAFDLIIGILVFRYYHAVPRARRGYLVPVSVGVIATLVNVSGAFCSEGIVEMVAILGGLGLVNLLLPFPSAGKETKAA
jgi:hypothetical protein